MRMTLQLFSQGTHLGSSRDTWAPIPVYKSDIKGNKRQTSKSTPRWQHAAARIAPSTIYPTSTHDCLRIPESVKSCFRGNHLYCNVFWDWSQDTVRSVLPEISYYHVDVSKLSLASIQQESLFYYSSKDMYRFLQMSFLVLYFVSKPKVDQGGAVT